MKKKILATALISTSLLGICCAGVQGEATRVDNFDTEVGIGFSGHDVPPGTGDLQMKWAPIGFDFGSANEINATLEVFKEDTGTKKYVVVSDDRADATRQNWSLTASMSELKSGTIQLTGATLSFDTAKQAYQGTARPEVPGSIIPATPQHTAEVSPSPQELKQGDTGVVLMKDNGSGTKSYKGMTALEMSDIELSVPGGVARNGRHYTGKLTWSLNDTI